jgi:outer membrane protein assembly factor BamB
MNRFKKCVLPILVAGLVLGSRAAHAENWPQWRGPFFNGSTTEKDLPVTWSKTENVVWSAALPGYSGATPAIWGDYVFVSSPDDQKNLNLICLNRKDGKVRWQKQVATGDRKTDQGNNMASPSPVTDGKRVIIMFGTGDLAAFDFSGKELWSRNLGKEYGKFTIMWLYGSSPLLYQGKLYVQVLQTDKVTYPQSIDGKSERDSYLLCLDPADGKNIWRQIRKTDAFGESMEAYTTPVPYEGKKRSEIVVVGGNYVTGHDPKTGEELWRCGGLNLKSANWMRTVSSAVTSEDFIYATSPKREPLIAIKAGGSGVITDTHIAWKLTEHSPDVCTPLYYQKKLFVLDGDKQVLTCLDPVTGAVKWQGNLGVRETFRASPTGADGKIYCISMRSTAVVLEAGDEFKILATNRIDEKHDHSSIAVSNGELFIRTAQNLYCIGKK